MRAKERVCDDVVVISEYGWRVGGLTVCLVRRMSRRPTMEIDAARINPSAPVFSRRTTAPPLYTRVGINPPLVLPNEKREIMHQVRPCRSRARVVVAVAAAPRRSVTRIKTKPAKNISRRKKSVVRLPRNFSRTPESYSRCFFPFPLFSLFFFQGIIFAVFLSFARSGPLIYSSASNRGGNES